MYNLRQNKSCKCGSTPSNVSQQAFIYLPVQAPTAYSSAIPMFKENLQFYNEVKKRGCPLVKWHLIPVSVCMYVAQFKTMFLQISYVDGQHLCKGIHLGRKKLCVNESHNILIAHLWCPGFLGHTLRYVDHTICTF